MLNCCTSNETPPPDFRQDDVVGFGLRPEQNADREPHVPHAPPHVILNSIQDPCLRIQAVARPRSQDVFRSIGAVHSGATAQAWFPESLRRSATLR